jgi:hypothetical protein
MKNNHRTVMLLRKRIHWYLIMAGLAIMSAITYHHFVKNYRIESHIYIEPASTNPILSATDHLQPSYRQRFQSSLSEKLIRNFNAGEFFTSLAKAMKPHQQRILKIQRETENNSLLKNFLTHSTQIYEIDDRTIAIILHSKDPKILPWLSEKVTGHAITYATELQLSESNQAIKYLTEEIEKTTKSTQQTLEAIVELRTARNSTNETSVSTMGTRDLFYKASQALDEANFANRTVDAEILAIKKKLAVLVESSATSTNNDSIITERILDRIESNKINHLSNATRSKEAADSALNLEGISGIEFEPEALLQLLQEKKTEKINLDQKYRFLNERTKELATLAPLSESSHLKHEYLRRDYLSKLERLKFLNRNITRLELKKISIKNKIKPVSRKSGNAVFHIPSRKKLVIFAIMLAMSAVFICFIWLDYAFPKILLKQDLGKQGNHHTFTLPTIKTVGKISFSWAKNLQTPRVRNSQLVYDSSCKQIINQLDFIATNQQIKTPITCTQSHGSNEGKTHTAYMLAEISANQDDKVALIDADWYKQSLDKLFTQKDGDRHQNITLINREFFQNSSNSSQQFFDNISTLLKDEPFLTHFDKIFIDMPPYFVAPESSEVVQASDFILLLSKSGYTNIRHFFELKERIESLIHNPRTTYFSVINNVTELNSTRSYMGYGSYGYSKYQYEAAKQPNKQPTKNPNRRKAV